MVSTLDPLCAFSIFQTYPYILTVSFHKFEFCLNNNNNNNNNVGSEDKDEDKANRQTGRPVDRGGGGGGGACILYLS